MLVATFNASVKGRLPQVEATKHLDIPSMEMHRMKAQQSLLEQDMDEGVPETQVHETSRARRDLFGPSSPSLPPMLLGAHPKPRAEDMRTQQKQATAGDKAFKDLVAKRIEARCAREVLSAAIRKFCCGRQCLRKLGSTRLKVIRTTFFSMTKGAQ